MAAKVNDRLVEIVAIITIPLISTIGYMVIDQLKEQNINQKEIRREVSKINGFIHTFVSEITTLKANVREINVKVDGISKRVYKLEGRR